MTSDIVPKDSTSELSLSQTLSEEKSQELKNQFIKRFPSIGYIDKTAEVVGINRRIHYFWLDRDPEYAKQFEIAKQQFLETFEVICDQRAKEGIEKPITYQGQVTGTYREPSDNLLMFRMKALAPEKYRDNITMEHTGDIEITISRGVDKRPELNNSNE